MSLCPFSMKIKPNQLLGLSPGAPEPMLQQLFPAAASSRWVLYSLLPSQGAERGMMGAERERSPRRAAGNTHLRPAEGLFVVGLVEKSIMFGLAFRNRRL